MKNHDNLFSIKTILPHIALIALIIGGYYYLSVNDLFPQWIDYVYYGGKALIAFIIILGSARSGMMPTLALISGLLILFTSQVYDITLVSSADAWEILIMAFIGLIITILVKW
jgi:hypothetical protein